MKKLSAYQCWKKGKEENLNDAQFKQLLIDNGCIIKKEPKHKIEQDLIDAALAKINGGSDDLDDAFEMMDRHGSGRNMRWKGKSL